MRLPVTVVSVVVSSLLATPGGRFVVLVGGAVPVIRCSSEDCTGRLVPDALPDGRVGQPYFFQLSVEANGSDCAGQDFHDFDKIALGREGLPAGMKLSEGGALDGIPLQEGSYAFAVTGHYWHGGGSEYPTRVPVTRRYELTILPR